jgi:hypothetical protein
MIERDIPGACDGLPMVADDQVIPLSPDTLSVRERFTITHSAEAITLDIEHPRPFLLAQDVFVAEPPHPAETSML